MLLNKKGTSLVELIVSVALISVVLIFMFRLLLDLNNEQTNDDFAKENQINRAEILRAVGNDLNNNTISSISSIGSTTDTMHVNFYYKNGTKTSLTINETTLTLLNSNNETRKWTFKDSTFYPNKANVYVKQDNNIYSIIIDLEIHTNNDNNTIGNNNTLDDLSITYIGYINDYNPNNMNCLGHDC